MASPFDPVQYLRKKPTYESLGAEEQAASFPPPRTLEQIAAATVAQAQAEYPSVGGSRAVTPQVMTAEEVANENARLAQKGITPPRRVAGFAVPTNQGNYGPEDFAFRNKLADNRTNRAIPGDTLTVNYGPAFGGNTTITATADKTGRYNQFTGVGTPAPATADPYGVNADLAAARQRAAHYRAMPGITSKIFAANAERSANQIRRSAYEAGTLGVAQGRLKLDTAKARPDIALHNLRNQALKAGDLNAVRELTAAIHGKLDATVMKDMLGGSRVIPHSAIPPEGAYYPGVPVNQQGVPPATTAPQLDAFWRSQIPYAAEDEY